MAKKIIFSLLICLTSLVVIAADQKPDCAILLHGFARTSKSLNNFARTLNKSGLKTLMLDYPSLHSSIEVISIDYLAPLIAKEKSQCRIIHMVGYSMGGIIIRYYLAHNNLKNLGRVVLIASPNKGTEVANFAKKYPFINRFIGPAALSLTTDSPLLRALPEPNYEIGVISGGLTINPFTSLLMIKGQDDGMVSIESSKLPKMKDHIIINSSHTLLMYNTEAAEQVAHFLHKGKFK